MNHKWLFPFLMDPETPAGAVPPAPPANPAPWSADLEQRFTDPAVRSQVDEYLRTTQQPRMTQLEQDLAAARQEAEVAEGARELWNDFSTDPRGTVAAVVEQLADEFGEDAAKVLEILQAEAAAEATATPPSGGVPAVPPHIQEMYDAWSEDKSKKAYEDALAELKAADEELDPDRFAPFVVAADGDLETAHRAYTAARAADEAAFKAKYNITDPVPPETPTPPAALGTEGNDAPPPPPVEQKYASLDEAMDAFTSELKQPPPPVVGSA